MADVFLTMARGPAGFNKLAVVKCLRYPDDAAQIEMFLDEARLAARLNHPNIVHTYEAGEVDGRYFIAMEYLEGQSLQALVARLNVRSAWLSDMVAAYVAAQALRGLHFAHEVCDFDGTTLGVVHRDVSPHNLHVTYGGEVKLLDFGVAKAKTNAAHTQIGILKGKIRYMAPEQLGEGRVDRRADVFAFGIVLWELLAHRALFQGDAPSVMARLVGEDAAPVRSIRPDVLPELDAIALKALRRKPSERYATADEMRAELEQVLRGREAALDRELGRVMNETFADVRDEVRARIKTFLYKRDKGLKDADGNSSALSGEDGLPKHSTNREGSAMHTPSVSAASSVVPRGPSRWSWLLLAVGASVSGVVALGRLDHPHSERSPGALPPPHIETDDSPPRGPGSPPADPPPASAAPTMFVPIARDVAARSPTISLASARASEAAPSSAAPTTPRAPQGASPSASASAHPRMNIRVLDDGDGP